MDITFLVGNGFDLSMGYKTSYKDFYNWYLQQPIDSISETAISRLKEDIAQDIKSGSKNWSDFEIGLGKFTKNLMRGAVNEFVDAYTDAVTHLCTYLSNLPKYDIVEGISEKKWDEIQRGICSFYQGPNDQYNTFFSEIKNNEQNNGWETIFHFISFNYTDYLDQYLAKIAEKPLFIWKRGSEERKHSVDPKVHHVHGLLIKNPIVGVSNEKQILHPDFQKDDLLCSVMIKHRTIAYLGSNWYSSAETTIKKSRIVCLWGVSLGDSDKHWWNFICNWLKENQDRHLFIFEHTENPPDPISIADQYRKNESVTNRFLRHSNLPDLEKNSLNKRIHVIFNTEKVLKTYEIPHRAQIVNV